MGQGAAERYAQSSLTWEVHRDRIRAETLVLSPRGKRNTAPAGLEVVIQKNSEPDEDMAINAILTGENQTDMSTPVPSDSSRERRKKMDLSEGGVNLSSPLPGDTMSPAGAQHLGELTQQIRSLTVVCQELVEGQRDMVTVLDPERQGSPTRRRSAREIEAIIDRLEDELAEVKARGAPPT